MNKTIRKKKTEENAISAKNRMKLQQVLINVGRAIACTGEELEAIGGAGTSE